MAFQGISKTEAHEVLWDVYYCVNKQCVYCISVLHIGSSLTSHFEELNTLQCFRIKLSVSSGQAFRVSLTPNEASSFHLFSGKNVEQVPEKKKKKEVWQPKRQRCKPLVVFHHHPGLFKSSNLVFPFFFFFSQTVSTYVKSHPPAYEQANSKAELVTQDKKGADSPQNTSINMSLLQNKI